MLLLILRRAGTLCRDPQSSGLSDARRGGCTPMWGSSERDMAAGPLLGGGRTRSPCSQLLAPVSAAVWNFPSANEHHLPLEIGETVHILQASEGKGSRLGWG